MENKKNNFGISPLDIRMVNLQQSISIAYDEINFNQDFIDAILKGNRLLRDRITYPNCDTTDLELRKYLISKNRETTQDINKMHQELSEINKKQGRIK